MSPSPPPQRSQRRTLRQYKPKPAQYKQNGSSPDGPDRRLKLPQSQEYGRGNKLGSLFWIGLPQYLLLGLFNEHAQTPKHSAVWKREVLGRSPTVDLAAAGVHLWPFCIVPDG